MNVRRMIFTVGPRLADAGDACHPSQVRGVPVVARLAVNTNANEALVELGDRRFALTGATVAMGPARKLAKHLRRRAPGSDSSTQAQWLRANAELLEGVDRAHTGGGVR